MTTTSPPRRTFICQRQTQPADWAENDLRGRRDNDDRTAAARNDTRSDLAFVVNEVIKQVAGGLLSGRAQVMATARGRPIPRPYPTLYADRQEVATVAVEDAYLAMCAGMKDGSIEARPTRMTALLADMAWRRVGRAVEHWHRGLQMQPVPDEWLLPVAEQRPWQGVAGMVEAVQGDPLALHLVAEAGADLLAQLDPIDRVIVTMNAAGYTQRETAASLPLTQQAVSGRRRGMAKKYRHLACR